MYFLQEDPRSIIQDGSDMCPISAQKSMQDRCMRLRLHPLARASLAHARRGDACIFWTHAKEGARVSFQRAYEADAGIFWTHAWGVDAGIFWTHARRVARASWARASPTRASPT